MAEAAGRESGTVETMRRFTADASHEIRNPLSVLRVGLEVALRRPRDVAEYRRLIQGNLQEIQRLQAVLEGLLALAREVPGTPHPLMRTAVDLSAVVAQTVEAFSRQHVRTNNERDERPHTPAEQRSESGQKQTRDPHRPHRAETAGQGGEHHD
jgi:signal transduction histidine kinase